MDVFLKTHKFNLSQNNYDKFNESLQQSFKNKNKKEDKSKKKKGRRQNKKVTKNNEEKKTNYIPKIFKKFSNENKNLNNQRNSNSEEKSTKLTLDKENASDYTTSFATNYNLTPTIEKKDNNTIKNNDMNIFNLNNSESINDTLYISDINLNNNKHFKGQKKEENIIFFPNDLKTTKKNKKKNQNKKMINNCENQNFQKYNSIILNPYINEQNKNNTLNYNNTIFINPNINNKIPNINYNSIIKTNKNNYNFFIDNNYFLKNNIKSNLEYNKNSNNNIEKTQHLKDNTRKNLEDKNMKKFIYMSDILACPPIRINPKCSRPFIINNNIRNNNDILLNIKIKLSNSNNYIEIPLRENDNPLSLINKLNMDLSLIEKNEIYEKIENSLNIIKHFNDLIISCNNNKNIYELNNYINNHNSYVNKKDGI